MGNEEMLKKAVEAFKALTPEQQAEMLEEQRQSWVRGNVGLSRDERGITTPVMPRPAAPVDGLERYDISMFGNGAVEMGGGEYVRYDQAVAIIAAKDADNAALTARVKELSEALDKQRELDNESTLHHYNRAKTLETQLAAARKALEWYANPEIYRSHPHGIGFEDRDKSYAARAALEAQP